MTGESDEVLTRVDGGIGLITLNRPNAINSLNQTMVDLLSTVLIRWERDDEVRAVVVSGAGERGLCAGGDVVAVYHSARKDGVEARRFWRAEYLMNGQIGRFSKPYVALMDGIVMGAAWASAPTATPGWSPTLPRSRCPRSASGSFPTWAGRICCPGHRARWVCTPH
ncbi:enoyl-CoA hydratase/isomerase family protein [Mycobacterium kansasii 732]|nr:enoyl-CoA hydratase/isomerase family protein [Mycobacterium kansasii 732]